MPIALKRAYDAPSRRDGRRILVERLWPRGLSKEKAQLDLWAKDAAPSTGLRQWFNHQPERWQEFKRRYLAELRSHPEALAPIRDCVRAGPVTFVFASRELRCNNAVVLKQYLDRTMQR